MTQDNWIVIGAVVGFLLGLLVLVLATILKRRRFRQPEAHWVSIPEPEFNDRFLPHQGDHWLGGDEYRDGSFTDRSVDQSDPVALLRYLVAQYDSAAWVGQTIGSEYFHAALYSARRYLADIDQKERVREMLRREAEEAEQ